MVSKTYCDYCGGEIKGEADLEIFISGKDTDICNECSKKVLETLESIPHH